MLMFLIWVSMIINYYEYIPGMYLMHICFFLCIHYKRVKTFCAQQCNNFELH